MLKEEKSKVVEDLRGLFASSDSIFVTHYSGLSVKQASDLRAKMRAEGLRFFVAKNTLLKLGAAGSRFTHFSEKFHGPVAITASNDPVSAAKILTTFADENEKLKLVAAQVSGKELDASGIKMLSKVPPMQELRAKLISLIQSPAQAIASVLTAPASTIARVLRIYCQSKSN
jgi:large subunit ribosomal protein L10